MSALDKYVSLSPASSRSEVSTALQTIISGSIKSEKDINQLTTLLLQDIESCVSNSKDKGRLSLNEINSALLALKTLGRSTSASVIISDQTNFHILLKAIKTLYDANTEAAYDALRCVANALLLVESSRDTWVHIHGADFCMELLKETKSPVCIFLCSRILFLCTVSPSSILLSNLLGEPIDSGAKDVIAIASEQLLFLLRNLPDLPFSREAMVDLLKFIFNLLCHWPKIDPEAIETIDYVTEQSDNISERVMGERWSRRLDGILPSLLLAFINLPTTTTPLGPPMTHILHSLLPIPVDNELLPIWISELKYSEESLPKTLDSLNCLLHGTSEKQKYNISQDSPPQVLVRGVDLLEASLLYYMPGNVDPDDASVKAICQKDDVQLDHILPPLVLLLNKICKANQEFRRYLKQRIIPANLDRSSPLETRADTLGRCIRLMACVNHQRLKDAIGDFLFAICESDAQILSNQIGYGNAAGFLFNRGILSGPPTSSDDRTETLDPSINPITGMVNREDKPPLPEMSEEEKEREAEKLFVLFERLEKSSGMENPLKKALHEGKLEKYSQSKNEDSD